MKLLTLGDSFTYGDELTDLNNNWPTRLANKLGYELTNLAKPGIGNTHIIRNCVEHSLEYDLIIIGWSHYARIEFADDYGLYDIWPGCRGVFFRDHLSYRKELINYIDHHHSDQYLYQQYLINVVLTQNYLSSINKKYIMVDAFGNNLIEERTQSAIVSQINKQLFLGWPNETMMEWTWPGPRGPNGHFLESGHKQVADKIYEHIRNLGWIS